MKLTLFIITFLSFSLFSNELMWNTNHKLHLIEEAAAKVPLLSTYPVLQYPNEDYQSITSKYPEGKILLFGYGSLMNKNSALRSISPTAVDSMKPVIAFGFKRLFNYKTSNVSRWGDNLPENERAMLNMHPTTTFNSIINGVVLEIGKEDLIKLIKRETGYDLVPILVANWNEAIQENAKITVQIAYTFIVPDELRNGIDYTQTKYYPVRGYLFAAQEGASAFGEPFLKFWNETTFLSNGTTPITQWDQKTFSGLLDTKEP